VRVNVDRIRRPTQLFLWWNGHSYLTDYTGTTTIRRMRRIALPCPLSTDSITRHVATQALRLASSVALYRFMYVQFAIGPVLELLAIWMFCLEHILYTVYIGHNLQTKFCESRMSLV